VLVLEVVGGVLVNDETDRVWSEALLHVAVTRSVLRIIKVMDITMYQGTKVPPHRYLDYTNTDIYTIHIASSYKTSSNIPLKINYSVACLMSGTSISALDILPAAFKTSSALDCQISCQNLLACQVNFFGCQW